MTVKVGQIPAKSDEGLLYVNSDLIPLFYHFTIYLVGINEEGILRLNEKIFSIRSTFQVREKVKLAVLKYKHFKMTKI